MPTRRNHLSANPSRNDEPLSSLPPRASSRSSALPPEDRARADFYALLARLYADVPDQPLLAAIAAAPAIEGDTPFATSWNRLVAASTAMDAEAAAQEYTDLFVGVGKSEVNLHASHWLTGGMMDKPLVNLRSDLAKLAIERREDVVMVEDHLSALCETMRLLIAGDETRFPAPIAAQRAFFDRHIASWVFLCCAAIRDCAIANYYVRVAEFTEQHMALDRDALAMD
ncbi:MAG TPA: molecular chaperone TorD family protein [Casimicrobiaceae bacterium]|nr:molecular chaperone TorD family protein [Casimicrobiaceae bacterium]